LIDTLVKRVAKPLLKVLLAAEYVRH
jgi:hypothetical protein